MAIASSSTNLNGMLKKDSGGGTSGSKSALDFYESMYHFKKMFPKLDSEVIETILRANHGQVDKTLDQLLSLNVDTELDEMRHSDPKPPSSSTTITTTPTLVQEGVVIDHDDSPPPYHELVKSSSSASSFHAAVSSNFASQLTSSSQPMSIIRSEQDSELGACAAIETTMTTPSGPSGLYPFEVRANWRSRAMIGELRRDFLRIRLTNEQLKKFKASIKKAKRDEITALVNNTTLERPKLSFELRRQMKEVSGQADLTDEESDNDDESSEQTATISNESSSSLSSQIVFDKQEKIKQLELDEYMAKLFQKEQEARRLQRNNLLEDIENYSLDNNTDSVLSRLSNSDNTVLKQQKLEKSGSSSKMLARFNDLGETASVSSASTKSKQDVGEWSGDEGDESYTVERIKWLEEFGTKPDGGGDTLSSSSSGNNKQGRYKKAYKSFKNVLKRNTPSTAMITNGLASIQKSRTSKKNGELLPTGDDYDLFGSKDFNNNTLTAANNSTNGGGAFIKSSNNDLILFQDDYSYDDKTTKKS